MRQKKVKALRKYIRSRGWLISAEPYMRLENGMVIASENRERYQIAKEKIR